jgi:hypothetical protein
MTNALVVHLEVWPCQQHKQQPATAEARTATTAAKQEGIS